jgi:hypothetical protein
MASPAAPAPLSPDGSGAGFFSILGNLLVAPSEAFAALLKRPTVLVPLALLLGLHLAFAVVWLRHVDPIEFMKARMAESPRAMQMPPEQRAAIIEQQAAWVAGSAWMGPAFVLIFVAALAGLLTFVYRFFFAGELSFKQGLAITAWVNLVVGLVTMPLTFLVLYLKGDWTVPPQEALQANPTLFFERDDLAAPLFALLGSLDLGSFWLMSLLALGFGLACRKPFASAIWGIGSLWLVYVVGKVALAAIF